MKGQDNDMKGQDNDMKGQDNDMEGQDNDMKGQDNDMKGQENIKIHNKSDEYVVLLVSACFVVILLKDESHVLVLSRS